MSSCTEKRNIEKVVYFRFREWLSVAKEQIGILLEFEEFGHDVTLFVVDLRCFMCGTTWNDQRNNGNRMVSCVSPVDEVCLQLVTQNTV